MRGRARRHRAGAPGRGPDPRRGEGQRGGNTIEALKERNIWVYAADMDGEDYASVKFDGAVALVIGAEGEGVSRRVLECCDKTVSLPLRGQLDSLNASVAAGVLMYAVMRFR